MIHRIVVITLSLSVFGCASNPFESSICNGFQDWSIAPFEEIKSKTVSFDWAQLDENSIPFYANMSFTGEQTDHEKALYGKVAQATHYIALKQYTQMISSCLGLRSIINTEATLRYEGTYKSNFISVSWEQKYCATEISNFSGCVSITKVKPNA